MVVVGGFELELGVSRFFLFLEGFAHGECWTRRLPWGFAMGGSFGPFDQVVLLVCRKAIRQKEDWRIINLGTSTPPSTSEKFKGRKQKFKAAVSFEGIF